MQALLARQNHRVTLGQAGQHFGLSGFADTQGDLHAFGHPLGVGRQSPQIFHGAGLDQFEHELASTLGNDGFFRHGQGLGFERKHRGDTGKHAGSQRAGGAGSGQFRHPTGQHTGWTARRQRGQHRRSHWGGCRCCWTAGGVGSRRIGFDRWRCSSARGSTFGSTRSAFGTAGWQGGFTGGVGHDGTHPNGAAIDIDQRIHRLHLGFEGAARHGIDVQLHHLTGDHFALVALGQAEVHIQSANVFQVDQIGAVFDIVTDVDVANAHGARKMRHDAHAIQAGARQSQLGLRHLQTRTTFIEHALGHKVLRHQVLVALVVGTGNGHLGQGLLHLGALQSVIQLHQQLTRAHPVAIGETQGQHATGHLRAQHHVLARAQSPHSLGIVADADFADLSHLNAHGTRAARCAPARACSTRRSTTRG